MPQSPIGFAELIQLHRDVFEEAFPADAGHLRSEAIDVAGDPCSAPGNIGAHLADFCKQLADQTQALESNPYENEQRFQTQVELIAWTHVGLLGIHPFIDGNGRIARLLLNIMLRRFELFPVNIKIEDGYLVNLRAARIRGEYAGFVAMLTRLIYGALEEFERSAERRELAARRRRPRRARRR